MKIADLFCGAGGAGMGLHRAGFEVVGFNIEPQRNYPFEFYQQDALTVDLSGFDAVWASPPCQAYSRASQARRNEGIIYPDLVQPTRKILLKANLPWIIENVPGAPIDAHYIICACTVGLPRLRRVRWFETSWNGLQFRQSCVHVMQPLSVVGTGTPTPILKALGYAPDVNEYRKAMDIEWMTRAEL